MSDPRAERRSARRAENRAEILDAAERVFGEHGVRDGSLRQIALLSGYSTAAIYLFFDNKQHLVSETLTRRGAELVGALESVAVGDRSPLEKLHGIVQVTVAFFEAHPQFRGLLRHVTGSPAILGPALAGYGDEVDGYFTTATMLLARLVGDGQKAGEVRDGDTFALAHLFSVLVNEHVLLGTDRDFSVGTLTLDQFHGLVDGAFRKPKAG